MKQIILKARIVTSCLCGFAAIGLISTGTLFADDIAKPPERAKAALENLKRGDSTAVPVLIDLLTELRPGERQPVEAALGELAGAWAPNVNLVGDDDISQGIRRDTWAAWWRRTDGPALLAEFRKRTLTADGKAKVEALLRKLNDETFRVRDQAMAELIVIGGIAVPLLRESIPGAALEHRRRV